MNYNNLISNIKNSNALSTFIQLRLLVHWRSFTKKYSSCSANCQNRVAAKKFYRLSNPRSFSIFPNETCAILLLFSFATRLASHWHTFLWLLSAHVNKLQTQMRLCVKKAENSQISMLWTYKLKWRSKILELKDYSSR